MKKLLTSLLLMAAFTATPLAPALAVNPDEVLDDPVLETRAREISTELRCVVCQNQSIDDSDAEIARDLRLLVRERLVAGDNDEQVVSYIVARYGDFVLLRPPWQPNTYMLWAGPPIMAIMIATLFVVFLRTYQRQRNAGLGPDPLSPHDRAELDALVERIAATTESGSGPKTQFRAELAEGLTPPPPDTTDETEDSNVDAGQGDTRS
ncbi:MAG: cytochrome c-type biogenesis protein CcmH [Alphaproteobacteria bacterium]|jgi:cytochrome c-type biogenesis protein CcmH|nr:cytochrome c-type biogenesis protein CcmH [Alphaproteobacteria bacterium]